MVGGGQGCRGGAIIAFWNVVDILALANHYHSHHAEYSLLLQFWQIGHGATIHSNEEDELCGDHGECIESLWSW